MQETAIKINRKVQEIESVDVIRAGKKVMNINTNWGSAEELTAEDYLKGTLNKEKILSDKIKVLEEELQRTREESFQAGYEEGKERGVQEAKKQIDEFKILIKSFEKQYAKTLTKMEIPLLKLAKKMAEKVVGIDLDSSAELDSILMEKLKRLLYEMIDQVKMIVVVNPVHLEWLDSPGIAQELNAPKNMEISFAGDENLKPGECIINTEDYHIDETYAAKLDRIEQELTMKEE